MSFPDIEPKTSPNCYLICPDHWGGQPANEASPVVNVSVNQLQNAWFSIIATEPRLTVVSTDPITGQYQYCQRSFVFHFPDFIFVQFIPVTETASTIALYSSSQYGYYDFGVNRRRLRRWLDKLRAYLHH